MQRTNLILFSDLESTTLKHTEYPAEPAIHEAICTGNIKTAATKWENTTFNRRAFGAHLQG